MNKGTCLCELTNVLIFPCSGGSNVGQIANEAAKRLTGLGHGKMYCLAGIGGHVSGIVASTEAAEKIVAIDGCPVCCAKKTLEHAGFAVQVHTVVTDLSIKKEGGFQLKDEDVVGVVEKIIGELR